MVNRYKIIFIIVMASTALFIYKNALDCGFVWDDDILVTGNSYIKSWSKLPNIFTTDAGAGAAFATRYYRPLQIGSYLIDYSLWKLNPAGYHFINVILHILTALILYGFVRIISKNEIIAFFSSLLFIAHPVNSTAITYVSGRGDPLAAIFILLSLSFYIKYLHSDNKYMYKLMLACLILALLSKENALILPLLFLLYHFTFNKRVRFDNIMPVLAVILLYILFRTTVLLKNTELFMPGALLKRIPGFFAAVMNYLKILIMPFHLHADYGNRFFCISNPLVISGMFISFLILIYAVRNRKSNSLISFSMLWFFLTLLPTSNIYPLPFYMSEQYLYLPSIGFFIILAGGLKFIYNKSKSLGVLILVLFLAFYSSLTIRQNKYWKDPVTLFERAYAYEKDNPRVCFNLAFQYSKIGKTKKAIALYNKALEITPNYLEARLYLASAYDLENQKDLAIEQCNKAIEIDPAEVRTYLFLANVYYGKKQYDLAIKNCREAIKRNIKSADAYFNLAFIYDEIGNKEEAINLYKKTIELNPDYAKAYNNLGILISTMGKKKEAIILFKKAIELNPNYTDALSNLILTNRDIGSKAEK